MLNAERLLTSVLLSVCLYTPGIGNAQPSETLSFRGMPMGVTEKEFSERFPFVRCWQASTIQVADRICGSSLLSGGDANYGGASVVSIIAMFLNDSLWAVTLTFPSSDTSTLISALTERYGKPAKLEDSTVQNRAGASFDQTKATWKLNDGTVEVYKRSGKVTDGRVDLKSNAGFAEAIKRQDEAKKSNAGKL
jgi:hypothetical protein